MENLENSSVNTVKSDHNLYGVYHVTGKINKTPTFTMAYNDDIRSEFHENRGEVCSIFTLIYNELGTVLANLFNDKIKVYYLHLLLLLLASKWP